ncbi:MAG: T9SS C-terminal target domain-containing protein [Bacteroidetes bacterium]|nr:MAG: T9SS C-terminal target domain-containing protein [Bacteroidota bacterium]
MKPATKGIIFFFRSFAIQAICIFLLGTVCNPLMGQTTISINEFMASNARTLADEDGDFEDWVELYNYGEEPVSLAGWGLSDSFSHPFQWVFPDTILQPGTFLLVWASGKDRTENSLHTNFSISSSGEPLLLTRDDGLLIDQVGPVQLLSDVSYGRQPDGSGTWWYFQSPTPGLPNLGETFAGISLPPLFSLPSGFYPDSTELVLYHPDPETEIVFTLDGSDPNAHAEGDTVFYYKNQYIEMPGDEDGELIPFHLYSQKYSQPLVLADRSSTPDLYTGISTTWHNQPSWFPSEPVSKATVVKATAVKAGYLPSPTIAQTYFIQGEKSVFPSELPVFSLTTDPRNLFDYEEGIYVAGIDFDTWRSNHPNSEAKWQSPANYNRRQPEHEKAGHIELFNAEGSVVFAQNLGYRIHGGASRMIPSKSLRLYARNRYDDEVFDYPFFPELPFLTYRRLLLRNSGQDWYRTMFRDRAVQKILEHLHVETQAALPSVLYINGEYWGIHNLRERYDKNYLERVYGVDGNHLDYVSSYWEIKEGDTTHFYSMIDYMETHNPDDEEYLSYIDTIIDLDNFTDYHVAQIFIGNKDWPHANVDIWRLKTEITGTSDLPGHDGRWRWLLYDTDASVGLWEYYQWNAVEHATNPQGGISRFFLRTLLANSTYRQVFLNRFADLLNTSFLPDYTLEIVRKQQQAIEEEFPNHLARWQVIPHIGQWHNHINTVVSFLTHRSEFQKQHLLDFFGIENMVEATLNISHLHHGYIRVNSIDLKATTPGVMNEPYPWRGDYFMDVPVLISAHPFPGYRFSHWEGDYSGIDSILVVKPDTDFSVTAHFVTTGEDLLVHYWQFDDQLPNNIPLSEIPVHYSLAEGAWFTFESCLPDYPYYPGHPFWRQGSMERRNSPTPLNYRSEGNNNLPYDATTLRGIQIKQPLAWEDKVSSLVLHLPTAGIENPVLRFAAKDEGAAKGLLIDFSTTEEVSWQSLSSSYSIPLSNQYQLVEFDLSNVEAANDNPYLKVRIRFDSDNPWEQDEKRIVFNNFSLDGVVCMAFSLSSVAEDNGHIFPAGSMNISSCTRKEFLIIPDANHRIENVWLDGVSVLDEVQMAEDYSGTFFFDTPYRDHELRASFELNSENPIVLYPNPASDELFIASKEEISLIQVYDISGRLLYEYDRTCKNYKMNTSVFNTGLYLVRIFTGTATHTRKVLVVHP